MRDAAIPDAPHRGIKPLRPSYIGNVAQPGLHTLKIYKVDTGVVIDKIVLGTADAAPSYLGPPPAE